MNFQKCTCANYSQCTVVNPIKLSENSNSIKKYIIHCKQRNCKKTAPIWVKIAHFHLSTNSFKRKYQTSATSMSLCFSEKVLIGISFWNLKYKRTTTTITDPQLHPETTISSRKSAPTYQIIIHAYDIAVIACQSARRNPARTSMNFQKFLCAHHSQCTVVNPIKPSENRNSIKKYIIHWK